MNMIRASWMIFAIILTASLYALSLVPSGLQLPIHWNIYGEADRVMDAQYVLLLMPALILGTILIFTYIRHIEPRKTNLEKSKTSLHWIMLAVVMLLALLASANIALALGYVVDIMRVVLSGVMLLLIVIGNFLPKLRSNYFIGIRLPWTLSSEENWRKTHYFGGRAFVILGSIGLLLTLLITNKNIVGYAAIALIVPMILAPIVYSWKLWHHEKS